MVDALGDVQHPSAVHRGQRSVEHAPVGFVGAHVLGGNDVLEVGAELGGGPFEQRVVDVGHNDEVESFIEPCKGFDRIGKRFPVADA